MAFTQGHALLIGVGSHQFHHEVDVPVTVRDAEAIAEVLQDANACGYLPEQVQLLHDAAATKAGVLSSLDALVQQTGPDDTVLFFYCGHGALGTDGNYYLVSHDAQIQRGRVVEQTGVSEGELLEKLRQIQAQRMLVIFNACYSGNISPALSTEPTTFQSTNPPEESTAALLGTGSGRIIITACRENQVSYIGSGKLSIFSQALVEGLRGKGVQNSQGFISAFSLYEHLYEQVHEITSTHMPKVQEPELTVLKGIGPFAVALYKGASALGAINPNEPLPQGDAVREMSQEQSTKYLNQRIVQTGGGAYVGGSVNIQGGEFVGRDKIIQGDEVRGDEIRGDKRNVEKTSGSAAAALVEGLRRISRKIWPTHNS